VIVDAFRSEWVKLRRPNLLFGTYGALTVAAAMFTALVFTQARHGAEGDSGLPSIEELARPNGLIHGLTRAAVLLGIVAFGLAAAQIASEYSLGTLRQLLVRQPRRALLLVGKVVAVITFLAGAVVIAAVGAGLVAIVMAHLRHIPTAAWSSSTGLADMTRALGDMLLAVVGYVILGTAAGIALRSSVAAVVIGFAYLLPVENVITAIVNGSARWLPGQSLEAVAGGGMAGVHYSGALLLTAVYVGIAAVGGLYPFVKRDVTA